VLKCGLGVGLGDEYWTERELAAALDKNIRTLRKWRQLRQGPAFCKIGREIIYRRGAVSDWLKAIETKPLCEPLRINRRAVLCRQRGGTR
jgi:hypothetical protein